LDPRLEAALAAAAIAAIAAVLIVSFGGFLRRPSATAQGKGSTLLSANVRAWYFEILTPIEDALASRNVAPTTVSMAQAACGALIAAAYAAGWLYTAGWLVLGIGSLDIIDGRLARRSGRASDRGAFLDSVFDRYVDTLAFVGLAVYFRSTWVLWVVLAALLGSAMVSYARARAEALFVDCRVGMFQRPERTVVLGFGTIFSVLFDRIFGYLAGVPEDGLLIGVLCVLAVMTNISAVQRIRHVAHELGER